MAAVRALRALSGAIRGVLGWGFWLAPSETRLVDQKPHLEPRNPNLGWRLGWGFWALGWGFWPTRRGFCSKWGALAGPKSCNLALPNAALRGFSAQNRERKAKKRSTLRLAA